MIGLQTLLIKFCKVLRLEKVWLIQFRLDRFAALAIQLGHLTGAWRRVDSN